MAGDALEIPTVKRALREVDVVTQSLGVPDRSEIILKPTQFFSKATQVLVTAMEEAQVQAVDLGDGLRGWRQTLAAGLSSRPKQAGGCQCGRSTPAS